MSESHQHDDPTVSGPADEPETIAARQSGRTPDAGDVPQDEEGSGRQEQPDAIAVPRPDPATHAGRQRAGGPIAETERDVDPPPLHGERGIGA